MRLSDFHYDLPDALIARHPLSSRSASRLMVVTSEKIQHAIFKDLPALISPNDLLVFNNTRVIAARLLGHKQTGGHVEILVERILDSSRILVQMRASKKPRPGNVLFFKDVCFEVLGRRGDLFELLCKKDIPVLEVIEAVGQTPIPRYFQRPAEKSDMTRYQTIYAKEKGSVAAPTAGLHFDEELIQQLQNNHIEMDYLTLHIGAGTFASVRVEDITQHRMHSEYVEVPATLCEKIKRTKTRGGRVIAVGTTTARSLETASRSGEIKPFSGETDIFIYPGFQFHCVDVLITNFHLPCSTLLMLVSAFANHQKVMAAYRIAVNEQYRFFSYGDAMWLSRETALRPCHPAKFLPPFYR